jgi:hypothetical protein
MDAGGEESVAGHVEVASACGALAALSPRGAAASTNRGDPLGTDDALADAMPHLSVLLAICALVLGCTNGVDGVPPGEAPGPTGSGGGSATSSGSSAGSASSSSASTGSGSGGCVAEDACLPKPTNGFQVESKGAEIQPGSDVEYCEVLKLPGDASQTYYVDRFELAMTKGSHHLIVSAVRPGSKTEAGLKIGSKKICNGASDFGPDTEIATGSQAPYHEDTFPAGVGKVFRGGQLLIFDYHYLNASVKPITARARVNFHTADASQVTKLARGFGFYNTAFSVLPGQKKTFTAGCTFKDDVVVFELVRHTHRWGTSFDTWYSGGALDGKHVWTSPHYEDTQFDFPEPVLMKKGTGFTWSCTFENTTNQTLKFGSKATDEMCILFGGWYSANPKAQPSDQDCWITN